MIEGSTVIALVTATIAVLVLISFALKSVDQSDYKAVTDDGTIKNIEVIKTEKTYYGKVRKSIDLEKRRNISIKLFREDITRGNKIWLRR